MGLHQGVTPYIPAETYTFVHSKPQVSFLVFTWALTASGGESGGFAVLPVRIFVTFPGVLNKKMCRVYPDFCIIYRNSRKQSGKWQGSHKANYSLPQSIREQEQVSSLVISPAVKAGSLTIFTEALTHGTISWAGEGERRTLLYKYAQSHVGYGAAPTAPAEDSGVTLTEDQVRLFTLPGKIHNSLRLGEADPRRLG